MPDEDWINQIRMTLREEGDILSEQIITNIPEVPAIYLAHFVRDGNEYTVSIVPTELGK